MIKFIKKKPYGKTFHAGFSMTIAGETAPGNGLARYYISFHGSFAYNEQAGLEQSPRFFRRKVEMSMKDFIESRREIEEILQAGNVGYVSMADDDAPYTIPITYGYSRGKIIFHCNRQGRKIDLIRKNDSVGFTVGRQFGHFVPHPQGAKCHAHSESVICRGRARIVEDVEERRALLNIFNKCIDNNAREIRIDEAAGCYAVEIVISEMTARIERDSQCTFYRFRFD